MFDGKALSASEYVLCNMLCNMLIMMLYRNKQNRGYNPTPRHLSSPACCPQHSRVNFLDLDIRAVYTTTMVEFEFGIYTKPGNACAYCSYHSRHVFRGWLKAKMHRLLTHSSNINIWLEGCHKFYDHLRASYPACSVDARATVALATVA